LEIGHVMKYNRSSCCSNRPVFMCTYVCLSVCLQASGEVNGDWLRSSDVPYFQPLTFITCPFSQVLGLLFYSVFMSETFLTSTLFECLRYVYFHSRYSSCGYTRS
jgi:hypothetical protein